MAFLETIGKALPNEFAKLASITKYVPVIGQALGIIGGIDTAATTYSDLEDDEGPPTREGWNSMNSILAALQGGVSTATGTGTDPGKYGSPDVNKDWANWIGQTGNLASITGLLNGLSGLTNYYNFTQGRDSRGKALQLNGRA